MSSIHLVIPEEVDKNYNHALSLLSAGAGDFVGYKDKLSMLEDIMYNPGNPSAVILGEAGVGKTALVEQLIHLHEETTEPFVVVRLAIETLGALPENIMIARMSTLLDDMRVIRKATQKGNPGKRFKLILFIDEVHKLNDYGKSVRSSAALNALKEGLGRGVFPIITATTAKEYFENLAQDDAIDRRFNKVIIDPPSLKLTALILRRHIESLRKKLDYVPEITDRSLTELVNLADVYVRNQVNPAKSKALLDSCVGRETRLYMVTGEKRKIDHLTFRYIFKQEGYNIDPPASAKVVRAEIHRRVKGQPLAVKLIGDAINNAFYAPRNRKKPLFTALLVGTTGVGKTETAKAVAKALFGRDDAILTINGGDYPTAEDAPQVQKIIGDDMAANKQKVILLDEFEKSHRTVQFSLMRMLDEGIVRDSHGVDRAINSTVVLGTSNLGADFFNKMGKNMQINRNEHPNDYSDEMYQKFNHNKSELVQALVNGDTGQNNGIKPEILQRFQAIIPYLPLPPAVMAMIARIKVEALQKGWSIPGSIYSLGNMSIRLILPQPESGDWWYKHLGNKVFYDIDPVSVMIADDMISREGDKEGARAIDEIINTRLVSKVSEIISDRIEEGLPVDSKYGGFLISTNGHATFESTDRGAADISVKFLTNEDIREETESSDYIY
ncbi:AAA family ATPase [Lactobacillus sp.]|uniref:AAA family ATPase n=1 Tax=Lactobacillus sp. TaxID=1591 RepID=UPI0019BAF2CA|nr:AAA family ATPase [Lactobacillus sp.]MBD5430502.1 ATP-dependent Clp protease ATP-binding subunit [Lactobacillus sp.]